tara:strand:- start:3325 stop:3483 length:159 start_codon:yes stop_codon:yes gene_type:complete
LNRSKQDKAVNDAICGKEKPLPLKPVVENLTGWQLLVRMIGQIEKSQIPQQL